MKKTVAIAATAQMDMITEEQSEATVRQVVGGAKKKTLTDEAFCDSAHHCDKEAGDMGTPWKR